MGKSGNPAKRAADEQATTVAPSEQAPVTDENGTEDFDAFWSSRKRRTRTTRIMGQTVELPPALPLQFEMEARRLQRSASETDVRHLIGILFGDDALDGWIAAGMDAEQFAVLLAWAPLAIAGDPTTLAEVADQIEQHNAAQEAEGADPH